MPSLPDEMIPVQPIALTTTTTRTTATTSGEALATMRPPPTTHRATSPLSAYDDLAKSTTLLEGNQLSLPETSGAGGVKKTEFDFDDRHANFRVIVSPKTDYVKTTHKGEREREVDLFGESALSSRGLWEPKGVSFIVGCRGEESPIEGDCIVVNESCD